MKYLFFTILFFIVGCNENLDLSSPSFESNPDKIGKKIFKILKTKNQVEFKNLLNQEVIYSTDRFDNGYWESTQIFYERSPISPRDNQKYPKGYFDWENSEYLSTVIKPIQECVDCLTEYELTIKFRNKNTNQIFSIGFLFTRFFQIMKNKETDSQTTEKYYLSEYYFPMIEEVNQ